MQKGTVKWFNNKKGFGFISKEDGDSDLFVHHTGINGQGYKSLNEGDNVEFEEVNSEKGLRAVSVNIL